MAIKDFLLEANSKNIVTILDIGSSKIVCLIASIDKGQITIIGNGCQSANGFKNGNISDAKLAKSSIISAIDQAEKAANLTIDKVILALNGNKIRSHYLNPSIILKKQKVTSQDIDYLISSGIKELEKNGNEIIHYFSLSYKLDESNGIKNPKGLLGNKLSAKIHYVTVSSILLENLINCLASCQLDVEDCVFAPYSAGLATLNDNDKEFGATIIDFGDGITSYALFSQNNMVHCGFVPIGSKSITNDIAKSFMLDVATAERIKTIHGAASVNYSDNKKMIYYKTDGNFLGHFEAEERSISNAELNEVINARIDEILKLLKEVLSSQYMLFPNTQHNIIFTGGGSMLTGLAQEASKILASKVKLGKLKDIQGLSKEAVNATYAAAIGTLQYIADNNSSSDLSDRTKLSAMDKFINWIKHRF